MTTKREWKEFTDEQPTTPCPDDDKPYMWLDGKWILMASTTADGVPRKLHFAYRDKEKEGDEDRTQQ